MRTFHEDSCMRQWRPTISRTVFTSPPSMEKLTCRGQVRRQLHGLSSQAHLHVDGLHAPKRPTISRMVFTSPPTMRNACKQFAEFGDNFKDCLHKPTFHEDGLQAPMAANNLKDGLHKPTLHEDGLQAVGKSTTISRIVFTSPPSTRMVCRRHSGQQSQGWSPQAHLA